MGINKGVQENKEDEGNEVEEVVEVEGGDSCEDNSKGKGRVGTNREGKARWKVVMAKRPSVRERKGLGDHVESRRGKGEER